MAPRPTFGRVRPPEKDAAGQGQPHAGAGVILAYLQGVPGNDPLFGVATSQSLPGQPQDRQPRYNYFAGTQASVWLTPTTSFAYYDNGPRGQFGYHIVYGQKFTWNGGDDYVEAAEQKITQFAALENVPVNFQGWSGSSAYFGGLFGFMYYQDGHRITDLISYIFPRPGTRLSVYYNISLIDGTGGTLESQSYYNEPLTAAEANDAFEAVVRALTGCTAQDYDGIRAQMGETLFNTPVRIEVEGYVDYTVTPGKTWIDKAAMIFLTPERWVLRSSGLTETATSTSSSPAGLYRGYTHTGTLAADGTITVESFDQRDISGYLTRMCALTADTFVTDIDDESNAVIAASVPLVVDRYSITNMKVGTWNAGGEPSYGPPHSFYTASGSAFPLENRMSQRLSDTRFLIEAGMPVNFFGDLQESFGVILGTVSGTNITFTSHRLLDAAWTRIANGGNPNLFRLVACDPKPVSLRPATQSEFWWYARDMTATHSVVGRLRVNADNTITDLARLDTTAFDIELYATAEPLILVQTATQLMIETNDIAPGQDAGSVRKEQLVLLTYDEAAEEITHEVVPRGLGSYGESQPYTVQIPPPCLAAAAQQMKLAGVNQQPMFATVDDQQQVLNVPITASETCSGALTYRNVSIWKVGTQTRGTASHVQSDPRAVRRVGR